MFIGAESLPPAMYNPMVLLIAVYVVLSVLAGRARSHDDRAKSDRYANFAFAVVLLAAVYAVVLLITAIFSYPSRTSDMILIIVVIGVFFAVLLFAFFVIAELLPHALRRGKRER